MMYLQLKEFEKSKERNKQLQIKTEMKVKIIKQVKKVTLVVLVLKIFKTIQQNFYKQSRIVAMKYSI